MTQTLRLGVTLFSSAVILAATSTSAGEKDTTDITGEVRELNSAKYASPPVEFRKGKTTPRAFDAKSVEKTSSGFTIKLPSDAPVPTPTVYRNRLYVGGGFHSKTFFCFDAKTGQPVWGIDLDDDGPTSAVCEDGVTVFNTESCTMFAVDSQTGKLLWSYWLGDPLTSTPTIAKGRVFSSYPVNGRGGIQSIPGNQSTPEKKQSKKSTTSNADNGLTAGAAKQPPPNCSHVLACFDLKTGRIIWQRWLDSDVMTAPIAVDDDLYATSFSGVVYRFKQSEGTLVSAHRSRATSAPVVVGGNVFLTKRADADGKVAEEIAGQNRATAAQTFAANRKEAKYLDADVQARSSLKAQAMQLDAGNGFGGGAPGAANAMAGMANVGQNNVSSLQAFQGSRILHCPSGNVTCMGDELVCSDPANGNKRWSIKLQGDLEKEGGFLASPPAAAGGDIFLATLKGEVLQVDPSNAKIRKSYSVGSAVRFQPVIEGGRIYVGTQDGKVVCLETGDPKFTGWSMWGGNAAHSGVALAAK
jgi:outer membrane protein assembly factor BamB